MNSIDLQERRKNTDVIGDVLRNQLLDYSKDFKTSWIGLGQSLYAVWEDKLYHGWGFEKFEDYTEGELGLQKNVAMKLLKTYLFIEQHEPDYLTDDFKLDRDALQVPGCEEVNVLRMARNKKELNKDDYFQLKKAVFEKGCSAAEARKELTAIMKERKPIDPEEEREQRHESSIRKLLSSLKMFKKDMEALKLIPHEIIEEAKGLIGHLETELPN